VLIRQLQAEKDASTRAALILALGEYTADQLPPKMRTALTTKLLAWYRNDPDPGVHSAIDWLLRHGKEGPLDRPLRWRGRKALEKIDTALAGRPGPAGRRWYVNGQGQTLTAVPGSVKFFMGSPPDEPDRGDDETLHRGTIGRSFAIAAKPVTVVQWEKFLQAMKKRRLAVRHECPKKYAPDLGCPVVSVTWYEAAMYCRWLSEVEEVPPEQMVYPPIADILKCAASQTPLKLPNDYQRRTGYRLPSEAEFEYACRADTATRWCCGWLEESLPRYAWFVKNCADRTWPAGQKKPNDLGLFDVHGNAWNWCQDCYRPYSSRNREGSEEKRNVHTIINRVLRGGSFLNHAVFVRSAFRRRFAPADRGDGVGFRLAKTLPPGHFAVIQLK
jgi:formylglycine-generating enzyme required for sulfatase activity